MPEPQLAIYDGDESTAYGRIETTRRGGSVSSQSRRRTDFVKRRAAVQRSGEQQIANSAGQLVEPCGEGPLQPRGEVRGLHHDAAVGGAFGGNGSCELYDGERIAGRLREDARANYRRKAGGPQVDQLPGCDGTEAFEVEHGKPSLVERRCITRSHRTEKRDRLVLEAPSDECDHPRARSIDPVSVVDHHYEWRGLGGNRQKVKRSHCNAIKIGSGFIRYAEHSVQCASQRDGQTTVESKDRKEELMQAGERELGF